MAKKIVVDDHRWYVIGHNIRVGKIEIVHYQKISELERPVSFTVYIEPEVLEEIIKALREAKEDGKDTDR